MGRHCTVCIHSERVRVEKDLIGPDTYRQVADRYDLSASALKRHRYHHMDEEAIAELQERGEGDKALGLDSAYGRLALAHNGLQLQRFVDELLATRDFNQTAAAKRAGASARSASNQGYRWMSRDDVRAAVMERLMARRERTELRQDEVVAALARIATSDVRDLATWDEDGRLRVVASRKLGPEAQAIKTFKEVGGRLVPVLHSKHQALKLLLAHLGGTTERAEQTFRLVQVDPETGEEIPLPLPPIEPTEPEEED